MYMCVVVDFGEVESSNKIFRMNKGQEMVALNAAVINFNIKFVQDHKEICIRIVQIFLCEYSPHYHHLACYFSLSPVGGLLS